MKTPPVHKTLILLLFPTVVLAQSVFAVPPQYHPMQPTKENEKEEVNLVEELVIEDQTTSNKNAPHEYTIEEEATLFDQLSDRISKVEKKSDKFNLYLNMHGDFATEWKGSEFLSGKFQMRQLRVEAKGNINSVFSYRYRQRLNNGDSPAGYHDNIMRSIDYAAIGVKLGKWQLLLGKQCSAFGGIEFDLNPIEIYQYSDMIGSANNFLTGADVCYNFTSRQQVHL